LSLSLILPLPAILSLHRPLLTLTALFTKDLPLLAPLRYFDTRLWPLPLLLTT
jgi:hypothetical protein